MPMTRRSQRLSCPTYRSRKEVESSSETDDIENVNMNRGKYNRKVTKDSKVSEEPKTPVSNKRSTKRRSKMVILDESSEESAGPAASPSKQHKTQRTPESLFSPSRLLDRLSIEDSDEEEMKLTEQTQRRNKYQNARRVLNSAETNNLPGREKEIEELREFLVDHLNKFKSGSLYVSGPPGTGKTACLSKILLSDEVAQKFTKVYINCTSISTIGSIYKKISAELKLKVAGRTEKDNLQAIEKFMIASKKMVLLVLDEVDQLVGNKQSVLYTIFEWPAKPNSRLLLIGIANSLDLTDRLLIRLNAKCDLKPKLMHFPPYTKQQIVQIFKSRLDEAGVADVFPPASLHLLAAKVASVSGDVRRALDIGRRVVEIAEQQKEGTPTVNIAEIGLEKGGAAPKMKEEDTPLQPVQAKQVVTVLNTVYGASQTLNEDIEDAFPLQQKILLCSLLLMLRREKNKDITVGRLHDVYKRVCSKRNLLAVDQTEFVSLCYLVETRGILRVIKKKEPRLSKIALQWDEGEVNAALKDKQLIATILDDVSVLGR